MVAVEGGRQNALLGRLIDEIPRHLMEDEGVVGKVVIEGPDHPVSPRPQMIETVCLITIGVGKSRHIQPFHGHALTVMLGGQQLVDHAFVCQRIRVGEESLQRIRAGGQTGQIQMDAAKETLPGGLFPGGETLERKRLFNEGINGVRGRRNPVHLGDLGCHNAFKGPMLAPGGSFVDPLRQGRLLIRIQGQEGFRRWHDAVGVLRMDAGN